MPVAQPQRPQEGEGSSILSNVKYILLTFLVINTVVYYLQTDKSPLSKSSPSPSPSPNIITGIDLLTDYNFKPDLKNSVFEIITPPEQSHRIGTWYEDGTETQHEVITYEQAVYENSLKPAEFYAPIVEDVSTPVTFEFYVSDGLEFERGDKEPILVLDHVEIKSKNSMTESIKFEPSDIVRNNGSVYLHTYVIYDHLDVAGEKTFQLNTYLPRRKEVKLHKLVGGTEEEPEEDEQIMEQPIVSYWHPNVTIAITPQPGLIDTKQVPPPLLDVFPLDPSNHRDNITGLVTQYFPVLYQNKFWQLKEHMTEINSTMDSLDINLNIDFAKYWKIQALVIFNDGVQKQETTSISTVGMTDGSEIDSVKRILLDTNPYLLGITIAVTLLHSLLEFLAFKSDISHWRNKKDNVGVSVRSIVANVVQQVITLLYLIDNSEGTSYMILASQGIGILIEAWKITTVLTFDIKWEQGILPNVVVSDKHKLSETEERTKEYDSIAFKYLYWVSVPLLSAYAVYSLLYKEHKSWYSFIVTTLVGFVYTYGFLTLVPAVYINYRLKSVAHIPKKAMAYKFVNTFIDDLFAFVIKMPWLHRLATLRDDVIFLIYLYQTWIYRVDYSRINEFGQVGEDDLTTSKESVDGEEPKKEK